jgi:hypothetical protein
MIFSPFTQMTLDSAGDKIVFTGSVTLSGTINSPLSAGNPKTQFRFGLFQSNANTDETGWVGYFMHNKHGTSATPNGVLAVKPVGNISTFLSTTGQVTLQSAAGDNTNASLFNDGAYNLMLTIERNAAGELVVNSSIIGTGNRPPAQPADFNGDSVVDAADYVAWRKGGPLLNETAPAGPGPEDYTLWQQNFGNQPTPVANEFSQIMNGTHLTASTTGTYTFDRLGFLLGNNLAADRAAFANLDVTFTPGPAGSGSVVGTSAIPEPATLLIVPLAAVMLLFTIRRRPKLARVVAAKYAT